LHKTWSIRLLYSILLGPTFVCPLAAQNARIVTWSRTQSALTLAASGHIPGICVSASDAPVVGIAANALAEDMRSVTKIPVAAVQTVGCTGSPVVLIGTLGHSALIDNLRTSGKLDTSAIEHKWESYVLTVVRNPLKGVPQALVIAGSDRRGTAYGVFELSREMGVSPWAWWADVPTATHHAIYLRRTTVVHGPPTVRYRGIFLNDEDWGLRPWAAQGLDRNIGNIGPHTYEHVFELLLRLRANTLYPAMHPGTTAFNTIPENAQLADRYAIVMGSSHSEALLRNNVAEYSEPNDGPWDFSKNAPRITQYWQDRLRTNGKFENLYTVGMRGVHDSGMEGQLSIQQQVSLLNRVFDAQRALLQKNVKPDVEEVPQVFWVYKEVLDVYRAGLHVPEDVTLGWSDDNYGYIREFPTAAERTRKGGSGVYYHISYWGEPHDYLWLCTTPPELIREEMTKAYDLGASRVWILNVGDLKPAEGDIDYFLSLAWDIESTRHQTQQQWLVHWLAEQFPASNAPEMAGVLERYYDLNFIRKPEFMGFNDNNSPIAPLTGFSPEERVTRHAAFRSLLKDAEDIGNKLPPQYVSAYFELVLYPVRASAAMNEKFLQRDAGNLVASAEAYRKIQEDTDRYNQIEDGKWRGMMSAAPRERHVFDPITSIPTPRPPSSTASAQTVAIDAEHYDSATGQWHTLNLGISGRSVELLRDGSVSNLQPVANPSTASPHLTYTLTTTSSGPAVLDVSALPVFPLFPGGSLRFAASIDGSTPQVADFDKSSPWSHNVLRNAAIAAIPFDHLNAGQHTVVLYYMDPGVIFSQLALKLGISR
jgi:hypothetical protein